MPLAPPDYEAIRAEKDSFFASSRHSPIPRGQTFDALTYFAPNPAHVHLPEVELGDGSPVEVATSDGQTRTYHRAGSIRIAPVGTDLTLTLYRTPGRSGYFLPFRDATSGSETYGAGRYLDLDEGDSVVVDFNLAYHPYCAYSDRYSCALPPAENWLDVPIRAGERLPEDG
jgi:uncharacterized protein (DUF1684 family)